MFYGGDYNPEQWPESVHDEDIELMRRARVTAVTVGVFAWSRLEPAPGRYDFGWLDRILDRLAGAGIAAVLATPTASPPPWFSVAHPSALPVTADGIRLTHGSRDTYCASAPAYRQAARDIAAALAARYRTHPALALWHVHNEYGTTCWCPATADAFRRWLRDRYGDLAALNDAWTTAFWGQHYTDWAQIQPPRRTQYLGNPGQLLDFRRFTSDELLAAYAEQRDVIRAQTPGVPVTTNFVLGDWVPVDHARWAREVDLVAIDHYPSSADPPAPPGGPSAGSSAEGQAAFAADRARGWAGPDRDWLLMETAPAAIHVPGRSHPKEPGRMARQALAAVARGSRGVLFFQWRAARGGAEMFHSALVPHAGPDSRVFREAVALGERLAELSGAITGGPAGRVEAHVAIVCDEPSAWALQATPMPATGLDHVAEAERVHRELWRRGITADVVPDVQRLRDYRMVVLPMLYLMTDEQAAAVRDWVCDGGRLVVTFLSGVADEYGRVRTGGYPGALRDLLGIRVEEFHPAAPGERIALSDGSGATCWRETVHLTGAEAVVHYADGGPAITRHRVGAGVAWYVSTRPDSGTLLAEVAVDAGVRSVLPGRPPGTEAVRRITGDRSWVFLIDHNGGTTRIIAGSSDR